MATQVQWRRGTTAQVAVFTPAIGEVVVDTTLHQLVVGDGVTVGGFYVAKQSGGILNNVTFTGTFAYSGVTIFGTATSTANITGGTYTSPTLDGVPTTPTPVLTSNDQTVVNSSWTRQVIQLTSPINMGLLNAQGLL